MTSPNTLTGEAADRLALRALVDAWAHYADRRKPQQQAQLFVPDGTVTVYPGDPAASEPVQRLRGHAELADAFKVLDNYDATTHFNGQSTITLAGDRATGETYCLAHHLWVENGQRTLLVISIRYLDTFVRHDGRWLFAERQLITDWTDKRPSAELGGAEHLMTGKVAIISGASEGIGAGLVAGYRGQDWAVVASAHALSRSDDPAVLTVPGDISEPETAGRIVDAALERFERIDTLVNSAGVIVSKPFTDYTTNDYARVVGVDLTGFFWLTQRAIAEMATRYGGHVVTVSAVLAEITDPGTPAVLAALIDGGLAAATRSLAVEYAAYGIRVNAVSRGVIQTAVHPADSHAGQAGRQPPLGQTDDVVDGVLFLESSPDITGRILHIDGGPTADH